MPPLASSVGQLLWIGLETDSWNPTMERLLREIRPGGVIFFQRNIASAEQFRDLVRRIGDFLLESASAPPFLAVDLEGGKVDRFRELLAPLPSAREAFQAGMARGLGRLAGSEAASFSLNVDFAPVLDVASPASEPVLGSRTAGDSPERVARFGEEFLTGLAECGVLGCGKHFPGLGSGRLDSHVAMPRIDKEASQLWAQDLFPYRALASRLPMVMVAHAAYPGLEAEAATGGNPSQLLPASISRPIVTGLLKEKIGFGGLALSDDLEMGGVLEGRTVGEAAVAAIDAGCDMLLVCSQPDHVRDAFEAMIRKAESDSRFGSALDRASQKVIRARRELPPSGPFSGGSSDTDLRKEIRALTAEIRLRLATDTGKGIEG